MPVQKEADMDPEIVQRLRDYLGPKEPDRPETFDSNGLRYPLEWLREIGLSVVMLPLEWQAGYVDAVTYYTTCSIPPDETGVFLGDRSKFFCQSQLENAQTIPPEQMNATSIGNLAFMALYALSADHRETAIGILDRVRSHVEEQTKQMLN